MVKNRQPSKERYFERSYDSLSRFSSYFYQIDTIRSLKPNSILDIGIGDGFFSLYMRNKGVFVDTCDIDKGLSPDYVGDIRNIPVKSNSYEAVTAFQVLEHIPWSDFGVALEELHRVSKKYVVVSLPRFSIYFELVVNFFPINFFFKRKMIRIIISVPMFLKNIKIPNNDGHFWEIGRKGFSLHKIRRRIKASGFIIESEFIPILNPYHVFFVLKKTK